MTWVSDVYVCMHKHPRLGDLGACSPRKFFEIRCSEIGLRPFWDRSRAVGATLLAEYSIQFWLSVYLLLSQQFPQKKIYTMAGRIASGVTDAEIVCREF